MNNDRLTTPMNVLSHPHSKYIKTFQRELQSLRLGGESMMIQKGVDELMSIYLITYLHYLTSLLQRRLANKTKC
jgi:hypothetical protein